MRQQYSYEGNDKYHFTNKYLIVDNQNSIKTLLFLFVK